MAGGRRPRRRAAELAAKQRGTSRSGIFMLGIGLLLIIAFKFAVGDESAAVFEAVVGQQGVDLPESVLDKKSKALPAAAPTNLGGSDSEAVRP